MLIFLESDDYHSERYETGGCQRCDNEIGICTHCMPGFATQTQDNEEYDWVKCKKCPMDCESCDYGSRICTKCFENFDLVDGKCKFNNNRGRAVKKCKLKSPNGKECWDCPNDEEQYSFLKKKCVYCPKECSACNLPGNCISCAFGYKLNK